MRFAEKLQKFMRGRYGGDSLNTALSICSLVCFIAAMVVYASAKTKAGLIVSCVMYAAAMAFVVLTAFRTFSKNLHKRRAEYEWFRSHILAPAAKRSNTMRTKRAQRATHKFFRCPGCRQLVRVPRGKGKIKITCPKCGKVFIKKT